MIPKTLLLLLVYLLFPTAGEAGFSTDVRRGKTTIRDSIWVYEDQSGRAGIREIAKKTFALSRTNIPNFGWGKSAGWVRFTLETPAELKGSLLLQVNSAIFDELDFYLFRGNQLVDTYTHLSSRTPVRERPYPHKDFVFKLKLDPGQHYTVYLRGKNLFNNNKFPLILWDEEAFESSERGANLFWGLFLGIFFLIALLNFAIGFVSKMKVFSYYGMYVISLIFIFLNLEGYFYEYVPYGILQNGFYDIYPYFNYSSIFWTALFILSFTRVSLNSRPYLERGLRILAILFWLLLVPSMLHPLWEDVVSDGFLQVWGWTGRILILVILLWSFLSVFYSTSGNRMAVIYLIACIPPLLSYLIPQYFNPLFNFWIVQPYAYLVGFLIEVVILSVAMLFNIRAYLFASKTGQESSPPPVQTVLPTQLNTPLLSKREMEILTAFTNGFSNQEIASAMFISPHTVRTHIKNIYQKLGINSKTEAVRFIIEQEKSAQ